MRVDGPRPTVTKLLDEYLSERSQRLSPSSIRGLRSVIGKFATWWDGQVPRRVPRTMAPDDLSRYLWGRHRCTRDCRPPRFHAGPGIRAVQSDHGVNGTISRLRGFLRWAARRGAMDPALLDEVGRDALVRVKRTRRLRLTPAELDEAVTGAQDPWERAALALAVFTAGRQSELLSARVRDVDLDAGVIHWSRIKVGDDSDSIPITADLDAELRRWFDHYQREAGPLHPHHYLIPRRRYVRAPGGWAWQYDPGQPRGSKLERPVKEALSRVLNRPLSELRGEGAHTLRRSMARALHERLRDEGHGDPLSVVQALLGHTNRAMTESYIGVDSGRLERDTLLRGRSMFGRISG